MKQWIKKHEECIKRSARTFMQAAVGVFTAAMASGQYELSEWKTWILTLGASSVASGVAAAMNRKKGGVL